MSGELAGNTVELGSSPVVIGRMPELPNLIIPLPEISGAHARVGANFSTVGVWIEDMGSRNGTFIRKSTPGSVRVRIQAKEILAKADRFCLCGEDLARSKLSR
jgi:hypothetical protein